MGSTNSYKIACVSLGMVIIDEIHMPHRYPLRDVLGGSASFVTLGQRLFSSVPQEIGCLIIAGNDFPSIVKQRIERWGTTLVIKVRESEKSSRGLLVYKDDTFGPKDFKYLGTPLRATPSDLINTPLLHSKAFHFFGSPTDIRSQVPQLLHLRSQANINTRPFIVWEPLPGSCHSANRKAFLTACKLVDVFSPNHIEVTAIFDDDRPRPQDGSDSFPFDSEKLETYGQILLSSASDHPSSSSTNLVIIIRAGEHGALSMSRDTRPTWLPPYYSKSSPQVVDPTGAGNTFLGGYIAGWQKSGEICEAMEYGHVAASFALEQIGLPECRLDWRTGREYWNGVRVMDRLKEYKDRLSFAEVMSEQLL